MTADANTLPRNQKSLVKRLIAMAMGWALLVYLVSNAVLLVASNYYFEQSLKRSAIQLVPVLDDLGLPLFYVGADKGLVPVRRLVEQSQDIAYVSYFRASDLEPVGSHAKKGVSLPPVPDQLLLARFNVAQAPEYVIVARHAMGMVSDIRVVAPLRLDSDGPIDEGQFFDPGAARPQGRIVGYVQFGMNLDGFRQLLLGGIFYGGAMLLLVLLLTLVGASHVVRRQLKPLTDLHGPLKELARGNFPEQVRVHSGDAEILAVQTALDTAIKALRDHDQAREAALRDKLSAELASEAKSLFLAHMSHEIRTPLAGMIGFLNLLARTPINEVQKDYLHATQISANTLLTIINDILDFSKMEAGKLSLENIDLDLREVVEDALAMHRGVAESKGLELVLVYQHETPCHLRGDPARITQILSNLIGNAVKFTTQGKIKVTVGAVSENEDQASVRICVSDTGIGIAAAEMSRLFQPFSQGELSTTRRFGGTGLGLVIAQRLAHLMNGEISASSISGQGSTFCLTATWEKNRSHEVQSGIDMQRGMRVLLVSRSQELSEPLREMILSWGMSLDEADGTQSAVTMLAEASSRSLPFHTVLVDADVDNAAPEQFAGAVGQVFRDRVNELPRLFLLIHPDEYYAPGELQGMGYLGCVAKPLRSSELYDRLAIQDRGHSRMPRREVAMESMPGLGRKRDGSQPHFLVADDNEINRRLATIILMEMGGRVDQAHDGVEAVTLVGRHRYDLVFMDVHMPLMDGVSATQHIRSDERNGRHTPIVALTANALKGDMEKYLAAGMDGYLAKPIKEAALREVIQRWCDLVPEDQPAGGSGDKLQPVVPPPANDGDGIIDERSGIELARGKRDLWIKVLGMLLAELPAALEEIRQVAGAGDLAGTYRLAHRLSGSASYCGVPALLAASRSLEAAAKTGEAEALPDLAEKLSQEAGRLRDAARERGMA